MSIGKRLLTVAHIGKRFKIGSEEINALRGVNLQVFAGQFIAVVGRSGSGKTTLLNIMAGLDKPTAGTILFEEEDLTEMSDKELTEIRRHKIGFVFQSFGWLPPLSASQNHRPSLRIPALPSGGRAARTSARPHAGCHSARL